MNKVLSNLVVLSLFDGISCGHLALDRVGAEVGSYIASEVEKSSIRITQRNYPMTHQWGDVRHIDGYRLRGIVNLLIGGSPCQCFSISGKHKGMSTTSNEEVTSLDRYLELKKEGFEFHGESYLFWEYVRLLKEIKPDYFFLENVKMTAKWARIISDTLGVEPITINSSVASGQERVRMYWTNIPYTPIEDKGIQLGDVVLGGICGAGKHGKPNKTGIGVNWPQGDWEFNKRNKAYCLVKSRGHYKNVQGKMVKYCVEDCEVLQNVPKGYTDVPGVSMTKRIHALANGWTVDVIAEGFFQNLPWATKVLPTNKKVTTY
jgi:hypothetical protein